jgi:hypothetical protein
MGGFLLAAVVLAPSLAGRTAFFPGDLWMSSVPFALSRADIQSHKPRNALLTDQAFLYGPQLFVAHRALREGAFPLWNRFFAGGEPMLQMGLSGPLHPFRWPILALPWPHGFAWSAWLRFGLMWAGAYLFGRALALDRAWSAALGVGFCFAPGFIAHFEQPRGVVFPSLPWLLYGVERLAAARATLRSAAWLAPAALLAASAGYPPATFTVLFAAAAYAMLRLPWRPLGDAVRRRAAAAAGLALGAAMAAPLLLPGVEFLRDSPTFAERQGGGDWTLPSEVYRLLWNPHALGFGTGSRAWKGAYSFEEEQQYVGLLPWLFLLGSLAAFRTREPGDRLRLLGIGALAFAVASLGLGWPPLHGTLSAVPPFSFNSNPRMLFVAQASVVVLAALAARGWTRRAGAGHATGFATLAAVAVAATLAALGAGGAGALRPSLVLCGAAALFAAGSLAATETQRAVARALVPLLLLADLAPVYAGHYFQPPRDWADPARAIANLPAPLRDDPAPRVVFEHFTPTNLPAVFGVEDVRGYGFPVPPRHAALMRDVLALPTPETLLRSDLERPDVIAALERSCARWLLTAADYADPAQLRLEPTWQKGPVRLHRMLGASPCAAWHPDAGVERVADLAASVARTRASLGAFPEPIFVEVAGAGGIAAPRAEAGLATALVWNGPNAIRLEVPAAARDRDGWLVARVSWDRGWRAFAGERRLEVVPAQLRFLAVRTPAGVERVELRYRPPQLGLGIGVAAVAAALAAAAAWIGRRA